MLIALDFDKTYTADPELWGAFIQSARGRGRHRVEIVTMRHESEPVDIGVEVDAVRYTGRRAKMDYMASIGMKVDIWIDDQPWFILNDSA